MCRIFAVKILTWWLHIYDDTVMVNQRHIYGAMRGDTDATDATRTRGFMPLTRQHGRLTYSAALRLHFVALCFTI